MTTETRIVFDELLIRGNINGEPQTPQITRRVDVYRDGMLLPGSQLIVEATNFGDIPEILKIVDASIAETLPAMLAAQALAADYKAQLDTVTAALDEARRDARAAEDGTTALTAKLAECESALTAASAQNRDLIVTGNAQATEIAELKAQLAAKAAAVDSFEDRFADLAAKVEAMQPR